MATSIQKVALAFLVAATFQVCWHWLLMRPCGLSQALLQFYLSYDPRVGKGVSGWFDLVLPCIFLGFLVGWVCWSSSVQKVAFLVTLIAVGFVALLPIYVLVMNEQFIWWWPRSNRTNLAGFFLENLIKATLLTGFSAYFGRRFGIHFMRGLN